MINDKCKEVKSKTSSVSTIGNVVTTESTTAEIKGSAYLSDKFHPDISEITHSAHAIVDKLENHIVINQAKELLTIIEDTLEFLQQKGVDISYLPSLIAIEFDDGSLLVEWVFNDFHLGFSIEPLREESSWYIVTNEKLNKIFTSDYFDDLSLPEIVRWVVSFALQNS
jgi:hypothetical protein